MRKYTDEECDSVANDLSNILANWENHIYQTFFWKCGERKYFGPNTRQKYCEWLQDLHKCYESDYEIESLGLCMEADILSTTLCPFAHKCCTKAYLQALIDLSDNIYKFIEPNMLSLYKLLIDRTVAILFWKHRSRRKTADLMLLTLHDRIGDTIIYPISGFVDEVSPRIWYIFYCYVIGGKSGRALRFALASASPNPGERQRLPCPFELRVSP